VRGRNRCRRSAIDCRSRSSGCDDCPAGQPLSFPLAAKGSSTNVDYKKAFLDANTALDGDYLKQKLAVEKANPCPEKCSFPDFYTDPATPLRNETTKASGRVKATEWREGYTVEATISTSLSRMYYKTAAEQKTGRDGRERKKTTRRPRQKKPEVDKVA
jgi:hypothetical protein